MEGLDWTVVGKLASVARLVDADLIGVQSVSTTALQEIEGTASEPICDVRDGLPVEAFSDVPGPSTEGSSDQA